MADYDKAKALFDAFKAEFEKEPCDLAKCGEQLVQLKLLVLGSSAALAAPSAQPEAQKAQTLARETLELACFLSIRRRDVQGFERHVSQLKMYYNDNPGNLQASEKKFVVQGLFLLHLLASDRIGEFHTELELIPLEDHGNLYIKQPIELERHLMEGNYAKVLEAQKDVPQMYYSFFMERLLETVRQKVGASLERSYEHLPVEQAAQMLILAVAALQEFAIKENERKAREEQENDPMGDMTPSLSRRAPVGLVKWEVKDGKLYFKKDQEKRQEIPALDLMVNTIGYATDLERIV
jgi:26S proteasome regulatory subunit N12